MSAIPANVACRRVQLESLHHSHTLFLSLASACIRFINILHRLTFMHTVWVVVPFHTCSFSHLLHLPLLSTIRVLILGSFNALDKTQGAELLFMPKGSEYGLSYFGSRDREKASLSTSTMMVDAHHVSPHLPLIEYYTPTCASLFADTKVDTSSLTWLYNPKLGV